MNEVDRIYIVLQTILRGHVYYQPASNYTKQQIITCGLEMYQLLYFRTRRTRK